MIGSSNLLKSIPKPSFQFNHRLIYVVLVSYSGRSDGDLTADLFKIPIKMLFFGRAHCLYSQSLSLSDYNDNVINSLLTTYKILCKMLSLKKKKTLLFELDPFDMRRWGKVIIIGASQGSESFEKKMYLKDLYT